MILEAFKPGTAPPDNYSVVGYGNDPQQQSSARTRRAGFFRVSPDADRAVRSGTGGLY